MLSNVLSKRKKQQAKQKHRFLIILLRIYILYFPLNTKGLVSCGNEQNPCDLINPQTRLYSIAGFDKYFYEDQLVNTFAFGVSKAATQLRYGSVKAAIEDTCE